jgi:hypothetical protein
MTGTLELLRGAEVSDAVWLLHPAQGAGLQIEVRSQNAVKLALTHNGVPLISQIVVSKSSDLIAGLDVLAHLEEVDDHVPGSRRSLWGAGGGRGRGLDQSGQRRGGPVYTCGHIER